MNIFDACYILTEAEKGIAYPEEVIAEAKNKVAIAQAEFMALKGQIKES